MATTRKTQIARVINFGNARKQDWGVKVYTYENDKMVKSERIMGVRGGKPGAQITANLWNERFYNEGVLA
jgi:hypothetical protein